MRLLLRIFVTCSSLVFAFNTAIAQSGSNMGTEFYTVFADHIYTPTKPLTPSKMFLYITSDKAVNSKVEVMDGTFSYQFSILANQVQEVSIPASAFLGNLSGTIKKAIHITASENVSVYAHIYSGSVSGATMLLPVNTLGKDYQSVNFKQQSNSVFFGEGKSYSYFTVVAASTEDTEIRITSKQDIYQQNLTSVHPAGVPYTIILHPGEVYQGLSDDDLTGTHVQSVSLNGAVCKSFALFSGSTKLYIGNTISNCNVQTSDNLFQQVYPTATWGSRFVTAPLKGRESQTDIYRIVVTDPATVITGIPAYQQSDLAKGYLEFSASQPLVINADKPIQVVQYAVSQFIVSCMANTGDLGDPEMILLNPVEQAINRSVIYSTGRYAITSSFINVIIPTDAANTFTIDNGPLPPGVSFQNISGTSYSYVQIPVRSGNTDATQTSTANGTHTIAASKPFNAIAYGFGNDESYGYSAGASFAPLNETLTLKNPGSQNNIQSPLCTNIGYMPQLNLSFQVAQITWKFDDGTSYTQNLPPVITNQSNGQAVYTYSYFNADKNTNLIYFPAGQHKIIASVNQPSTACADDVEFDFNSSQEPGTGFTIDNLCLEEGTTFTYTTGTGITTNYLYDWDFGDGSTHSKTQNAFHKYQSSGGYQVKLTVANSDGCITTSSLQTINIRKKPSAAFLVSSPDCVSGDIKFTDNSTDTDGNMITGWSWDFGDGTTSTQQNPPLHTYNTAKTYPVKLLVTNDKGCQSLAAIQNITIYPTPVAGFTAPNICLSAGLEQFTNTSDLTGGTKTEFTYAWNFGDSGSLANTSSQSDPQHAYSKAGAYNVSLTVTSPNGCVSAVTKPIVVNTSNPNAEFTVINPTGLCVSGPVIFQDKTTRLTTDMISKVVWHWGDGLTETFLPGDIHTNGMYSHSYSLTSSTAQTFTVMLDEYTGISCVNSISHTITIIPNPVITITQPKPLCPGDAPFQIITNKNGFNGKETFTGAGITAGGLFNPDKAGPGTHSISYTFIAAQTGCTYTQTFNMVVYPAPNVTVGPDFTILEGDATTLTATVMGDNLTYKWYPSDGLNRDDILNPVVKPLTNTNYTLTVTSGNGCTNFGNISVTVLKTPKILNTFTPNGDGINDLWYIELLSNYPASNVNIYTRNGEKVFSSVGYSVPWDGKFKGADLPTGVYYYIVNLNNGRKPITGYVTIIR